MRQSEKKLLTKTETIKGETGKKIKLEELSLFIAVDGAGAICTATVTAQAGEGGGNDYRSFRRY